MHPPEGEAHGQVNVGLDGHGVVTAQLLLPVFEVGPTKLPIELKGNQRYQAVTSIN